MVGRRVFIAPLALLALALAAGCDAPSEPAEERDKAAPKARVVVAVIDTGINPYHAWFNASQPGLESPIYPPGSPPSSVTPEVLAEFGIDHEHIIDLHRTGNPGADHAADQAQWDAIRPGEPYWFRGTNLIAVGRDTEGALILPDEDPLGGDLHGVSTAAAVLLANPEAVVFFVEAFSRGATASDLGSRESEALGFLHPAVDIVSTSYGTLGNPPEAKAAYHSFESVVAMGKLHFSSAGNDTACPTLMRSHAGPWWSIGVSGFLENHHPDDGEPQGRETDACYLADFVGDYLQHLPRCRICQTGTERLFGTSLAAPRAAGVASRVLLGLRRQLGHAGGIRDVDNVPVMAQGAGAVVTNWQLRRALEQAAYVPTSADFAPAPPPATQTSSTPVNDAAPWLQVGWGLLTPNPEKRVVEEALARLGYGSPQREKDAAFCDFQTKLIEARHSYWDNVSPAAEMIPDDILGGGAAAPLTQDPFIYCGSVLPPL